MNRENDVRQTEKRWIMNAARIVLLTLLFLTSVVLPALGAEEAAEKDPFTGAPLRRGTKKPAETAPRLPMRDVVKLASLTAAQKGVMIALQAEYRAKLAVVATKKITIKPRKQTPSDPNDINPFSDPPNQPGRKAPVDTSYEEHRERERQQLCWKKNLSSRSGAY